MQKQHYIISERYRPSTLEGYVCDNNLKTKIEGWIENQEIPMLGFFGKPGCGKTTLAKILVKNIDCDYLFINATDKRGMDDIRNEIIPFVSSISFKPAPKIVILDEFTSTLQASQVLLLNVIETYSNNARFILTGNYPERLIEPLRSRLEEYDLVAPDKKIVAKHVYDILNKEQIKFDINDIASIVKTHYPDIRKVLNTTQKFIVDDKLVLPSKLIGDKDFEEKIISELKSPSSSSFKNIRQLLSENNISDFDSLYILLFDKAEIIAPGNEGILTIIINEHMYQSYFILDKEICFCSCIAKILDTLL
jgi:replication factor C small subunit